MYINLSLTVERFDYDNLVLGERIVILSSPFPIGRQFILVPLVNTENADNSEFLSNALVQVADKEILRLDKITDNLANLLNTSLENLKEKIATNDNLMLMYFRVYLFEPAVKVSNHNKIGFAPLTSQVFIKDFIPLISDQLFAKRQQQLKNCQLSKDSELESLQIAITTLSLTSYSARSLNVQIQSFLGWQETRSAKAEAKELSKQLDWIKTITTLGDCSTEDGENKKAHVHAGTDFENIVKKSLEFLGFTIDEAYKGGAGGLDLFCSKPYPLTGECKAGKSIPSHTVKELISLGGTHLGVDGFINLSAKLVIGAGKPTNHMLDAAYKWKVSIIKAMTLQKLVELKAKYDGAINLFDLKQYLQAGQIDTKIDEYIQKVEGEIKLRSQIVQAVKELQDSDPEGSISRVIRTHYNAKSQGSILDVDTIRDILIELSSPLAGYLGRVEENGKKCDRFYFLRDLPS